jgi:hypothetical protein
VDSGFVEIADISADSNSYTDNTVLPETTYYYQVKAYLVDKESSEATANATTPAAPAIVLFYAEFE